MKKWLLSLLFVVAAATCACAQAQTPQVTRHIKTPTYRGLLPKTDEYKLLLSSLPEDDEVVRYRFISGNAKRRKTNDWVVIPQQNTGLSDSPVGGYYANVWFFHSSTNRGRIEFDVANIIPKVPEIPIPPAATTNWSTATIIASVSPLDPNRVVSVQPGQKNCLLAAVRITGNGVFKAVRWIQAGIMMEGTLRNAVVVIINSTGQSVTLSTKISKDGELFFFTATTLGIPFDEYIDIVLRGDIPENILDGRYVLPGLWEETDIAVEDATGLRLHLIPSSTENQDLEKSEFCTDAEPAFFAGSASWIRITR